MIIAINQDITKETCWKLNGKPSLGDKGKKEPFKKAYQSVVAENLELLTPWRKLLSLRIN